MTRERPRRPVGVPGYVTLQEGILVLGVPLLAIVALAVAVVMGGWQEARRERRNADAQVELYITQALSSAGRGGLANDPGNAWRCVAARDRADGRPVKTEPYASMSRDLADEFVRTLCYGE